MNIVVHLVTASKYFR